MANKPQQQRLQKPVRASFAFTSSPDNFNWKIIFSSKISKTWKLNSIKDPSTFIETNILGTYSLLNAVLKAKCNLKKNFKFIHISTDEVFGDVSKLTRKTLESDSYNPSSPYSASKASADHLITAWGRTYNIPYNISFSCNNFGPNQNNEKFIPVIINNIINNKKIPIYGNGSQMRDWI